MSETRDANFATLAIHAGAPLDVGALQVARHAIDDHPATLAPHPAASVDDGAVGAQTVAVLEERVAALEGGTAAVALSSGQSARLSVLLTLLGPGDEVVVARDLRGLAPTFFSTFGWTAKGVDPQRPDSFVEALSDRTKAIFVETMGVSGDVTDVAAVAAVARRARVPLIVDNTLATPYLVRPLELGADVVVHSTVELLGAPARASGGLVIDGGTFSFVGDDRYPNLSEPCAANGGLAIAESFGNFAFAVANRGIALRDLGAPLSPGQAYLILAGLETVALRVQRHCDNALAVARHLAGHPKTRWVDYAGLPEDRAYDLAHRFSPKGAGAVLAFGVDGNEDGAALVTRLKLLAQRPSVGGSRSLALHPASKTRGPRGEDERPLGLPPEAVRLWIGLEDITDIIADLDQALRR